MAEEVETPGAAGVSTSTSTRTSTWNTSSSNHNVSGPSSSLSSPSPSRPFRRLSNLFSRTNSNHSSGMITRRETLSLKDFFEARQLDHVVAELMIKYGDGSGVFTKDQVANLVSDLKESIENNQILLHSTLFLKKLLIFVLIFCVLLLAGMFGLSYAVAAMTATTQVSSQGTMMTKDASSPKLIATDSVSTMFDLGNHNDQGIFCLPGELSTQIHDSVTQGRNVFMKFGDQLSGNKTIYQWKAGGTKFYPDGTVCFHNGPDNVEYPYTCIVPKYEECTAVDSNGRRLDNNNNNNNNKHRRLDTNYDDAVTDCINYAKGVCGYFGVWTDELDYYKNDCLTFCGCSSSTQKCFCSASGYNSDKCTAQHTHVCSTGGSQACQCKQSPCTCP